jgi:hypothetical protein
VRYGKKGTGALFTLNLVLDLFGEILNHSRYVQLLIGHFVEGLLEVRDSEHSSEHEDFVRVSSGLLLSVDFKG